MQQTLVICTGILGVAVLLAVAVYVFGRLRIEQQRTLQKLLERGLPSEELLAAAGLGARSESDMRRGVLLLAIGLSWSAVTFFVGGRAWILGLIPVALGAALILLRTLDGRAR